MTGRWKERWPAGIVAVAFLMGGARHARPDAPAGPIETPIVFTQLPPQPDSESQPGRCGGILRCDYGQGGRIVRLDPAGELRVLTTESTASGSGTQAAATGFSSACGADVSFDGQRILFAAKREPHDPWNIWEMNADGSGLRQITRDCGNCRSPAYQATLYTIISTEPWYQIMFVSDAAGAMNEYGCGPATSLYSCKLDGSAVRRLSMNLSDDLDPFLMADGRVLLAGWQRIDLRRGFGGRVSLFGINTDGADYALYCGDQGQRIKHMPCQTSDPGKPGPASGPGSATGLVVFVEADHVGWDGAGQLASVSIRRPLYSYHPITNDPAVLYHSPSPLPDGTLLVSRRPADGSATHAIYRLDPHTGRAEPVFDDPDYHDVHARALVARPQPDGRSSVVNEEYPTGRFYCLNAYLTDPDVQPHLRPGMIRRLRVIEGVPVSAFDSSAYLLPKQRLGLGGPGSTVNSLPPVVQKRLLGVVPVEEDGSFHIELPADVPVQLQTLDENGLALRSCGWIWVKHREPRGCIGCHEDPELTPENRFVMAVQRPGMKLTLPPAKRRTVDFRRDVMPIVAAKCASCHKDNKTPLDLTDDKVGHFNQAYVNLLVPTAMPTEPDQYRSGRPPSRPERPRQSTESGRYTATPVGKYVYPGQARTSPLIWRLHGRNTSRPWDASYNPTQTFAAHPPPEAHRLTDDERLTFVEWIDLGAQWEVRSEK